MAKARGSGRDGKHTGGLGSLPVLRDRERSGFPIWPRTPGKRLDCYNDCYSGLSWENALHLKHQGKSCKSYLGGKGKALASSCFCLA